MLELNKGHYRVLYIIAKNSVPIRKMGISQATARWNASNRNRVISDLENEDLIASQFTPAKQGQPEGRYYWLTDSGTTLVKELEEQGAIQPLPDGWEKAA